MQHTWPTRRIRPFAPILAICFSLLAALLRSNGTDMVAAGLQAWCCSRAKLSQRSAVTLQPSTQCLNMQQCSANLLKGAAIWLSQMLLSSAHSN